MRTCGVRARLHLDVPGLTGVPKSLLWDAWVCAASHLEQNSLHRLRSYHRAGETKTGPRPCCDAIAAILPGCADDRVHIRLLIPETFWFPPLLNSFLIETRTNNHCGFWSTLTYATGQRLLLSGESPDTPTYLF